VPHADGEGVAALIRAWDGDAENDRLAIALALATTPEVSADLPFVTQLDRTQATIAEKGIDWRDLAEA
jgi:hypothetical protein